MQKRRKYSILVGCLGVVLTVAALYTTQRFFASHQLNHSTDSPKNISMVSSTQGLPQQVTLGVPSVWAETHHHGGDQIEAPLRAEMRQRVNESVARLQAQQILPASFLAPPVLFELPIRSAESVPAFGYYTISNYFDHEPSFQDQLQDYRCGDRTYDAADGYNHTGTDFMPFPFPWQKMDRGEMQVIAAAAGIIVEKQDGYYDRECVAQGRRGNTIVLQHADGTKSWYLHLKNGSLLTKSIGDSVAVGELLGTVGSSGRSNGPHLHFEVHDANGTVIDPFFEQATASCNPTASESWWTQQLPYNESAINDIVISAVKAEFYSCDKTILPEREIVAAGEEIIFNVFYHNDSNSKSTDFVLTLPDGTEAIKWAHAGNEPHVTSAVWSFPVTLPEGVPLGNWLLEATYEERVYEKEFAVAASVPATPSPTATFTVVPTAAATATTAPATATPVPATATPVPATATSAPATATSIPATATSAPATATTIPTTATSIPATATSVPATATSAPTSVTPTTSTNPQDDNTIYLPAVTN